MKCAKKEIKSLEKKNRFWVHLIIKIINAADVIAEVKADAIPKDTAFGVSMEKANIEFPKEVVNQLKGTADADVSIGADVLADKSNLFAGASKLTDEQKNRLNEVDVYDFSVSVNDEKLEQFNASVTVTMPYELKDGEDSDGITLPMTVRSMRSPRGRTILHGRQASCRRSYGCMTLLSVK